MSAAVGHSSDKKIRRARQLARPPLVRLTSAFGGKADMAISECHVCF